MVTNERSPGIQSDYHDRVPNAAVPDVPNPESLRERRVAIALLLFAIVGWVGFLTLAYFQHARTAEVRTWAGVAYTLGREDCSIANDDKIDQRRRLAAGWVVSAHNGTPQAVH
jgi:hypothetical protein